jgi:hypothetical protein
VKKAPGREEVQNFWREMYGEKKLHMMKKRGG